MIRKGDVIRFKKEWQDKGDENVVFRAIENECDGRVLVVAELGLAINPTQVVDVSMIDLGCEMCGGSNGHHNQVEMAGWWAISEEPVMVECSNRVEMLLIYGRDEAYEIMCSALRQTDYDSLNARVINKVIRHIEAAQ